MAGPTLSNLIGGQNGKLSNVRIRITATRIKILCLLVVAAWLMRLAVKVRPSLSPLYARHVRTLDMAANDIWTEYIITHPVEVDERYGFKEMGFRAHSYAELARTHNIGRLERMEENLWHFAPGAAQIRQQAMRVAPISYSEAAKQRASQSVEGIVRNQLEQHGRIFANMTGDLLRQAHREDAARGGKRRGIVMSVSRHTSLAALQTITVLRELHGCFLPVEIYYHREDELPDPLVDLLKSLGRVSVYDLDTLSLFSSELEDDAGRHPGFKETWTRQALGVLASSFQEMLVIEPSVVFLQNPAELFSHHSFQNTGTLFFRSKAKPADRGSQYLIAFLKRQFDAGEPSAQLADSAFWSHTIGSRQDMDVVVLDKSQPGVLAALFMNAWIRRKRVRDMFWGAYPLTMNEGLWLAFDLSDIAYAFENTLPGAIGRFEGDWDDHSPLLCSPRTIQFLSPQAAHEKLANRWTLFDTKHKKSTKKGKAANKLKQNAAGEKPFWFHGGFLVPGSSDETYFTPNVFARDVPPYTTIEEDYTDSKECLYGATINKLKGTSIPTTLEKAIDIAHETLKRYQPVLRYHVGVPKIRDDAETDDTKSEMEDTS
ncbi:Alpha-mannosyltransferase [Kalmanozyma brasiliensis GHG001]|uniref:Mannosyltransferase n=1 Tax=Kalmanozyma brasiliensis (strain GHG001) TaxID=1365824 RepID=V5GRD6_KALBG|nr:Alpha-mannosyltransferase [Kalmanozyma brasiliensis GHG001]EST08507.1 Alpha-mannosyltransferase [Kalmanozyma brasiliensis GHG001]